MSDLAAASAVAPIRPVVNTRGRFALRLANRSLLRDLVRYGACSAAALLLDWGTLIGLVQIGVRPLVAAPIGFMLGMVLTYVLSITVVYADRRGTRPWREAALFVAIGIAGLGINQLSMWGLIGLGIAAPIAKAPTAGLVFLFNFLLRRALLFSRPRA